MITKHSWFMDLGGQIQQALFAHYGPSLQKAMEEAEIEGQDVNMVQVAFSVEPEPLTPAYMLERTPYMAETAAQTQMANAESRGVLTAVGHNGYKLTDKGKKFAKGLPAQLIDQFRKMEPISEQDGRRLVELLKRLVDACLSAPEPKEKVAIIRSRLFDPGPGAPMLELVRRYINDLFAFRDDAHVAAWRTYEVKGYEWEAFSHIWGENVWGDKASTLEEVAEKLKFRGYDEADYKTALKNSVGRNWLEKKNGDYQVTARGQKVRQEAETATDDYFYGPWTALNEAESSELQTLLSQLSDALKIEE